ncbi:MAG: LuxR C-terminal-related transcriptional regulator, partial [Chloroflexota bacterium]
EIVNQIAWLALDEGDSDPVRFFTYLIAALQTITPDLGKGILNSIQSPQPPPPDVILTSLVNEISQLPADFLLVLDDYHIIDNVAVDHALLFLLEHMPPQMHLVIASREDPSFPLPRMRARGELIEVRESDLRFNSEEAADFLNKAMGLNLNGDAIAALEQRTEGWIAGLQLAALSMQGQDQQQSADFIQNFSGTHHFVLDYLAEEVLQQQPEEIKQFLLQTSILDRLNGSLCDAVLNNESGKSQEIIELLDQGNLFVVPLDNGRGWYRYHHLFGDLLRQRLTTSLSSGGSEGTLKKLHQRASDWFDQNQLDIEAFQHATAAADFERTLRIIRGKGMPLQFLGGAVPIINWLETLPKADLDARPELWVTWGSSILMRGMIAGVEEKVKAAEIALEGTLETDEVRDLIGRIASIRATVAVTQHQVDEIIYQGNRALDYLRPDNLPVRTSVIWSLGNAHNLKDEREAALNNFTQALEICEAIGHDIIAMMSYVGLADIQEKQLQLHASVKSRQRSMDMAGDPPVPAICDAFLGTARAYYEWNDLETAFEYGAKSVELARQIEYTDRFIDSEAFMALLRVTQGISPEAIEEAEAILATLFHDVRQNDFAVERLHLAAVQVRLRLLQGDFVTAMHLATQHNLPLSQARVALAQGDASLALEMLEPFYHEAIAKNQRDFQFKSLLLLAMAHDALGNGATALDQIDQALTLAAPSRMIRSFVDEGRPMADLLQRAAATGFMFDYLPEILAAFGTQSRPKIVQQHRLVEPLSPRELEILELIAEGLSNREIGERLYLALNTVKGHNRNIFGKLQVQRRTEAVARARELQLV